MSTTPLARWQELACDAALVGLDEAERAELEALGVSPAELLALERAAGEVAAAAIGAVVVEHPAETALPTALADRVVARLASPPPRPALASAREPRDPRQVPRRSAPSWLPWALAAAAVVVAVIGWTRTPREEPRATTAPPPSATRAVDEREALLARPDTARLPWKATKDEAARSAGGEVVWNEALQRGFMRFRGLSANNPAESQYQLWIFDGERDEAYPVDGGVFDVRDGGEVVVPIAAKLHVAKPKLFAITVEKPGGVVVSKRERIVLTAAPPG